MPATAVPDTPAARGRHSLARRLSGPVAVAAAVLAGCVALRLRDPHRSGSWGHCPFHALTGLDCPFCGCLRAVNDLGAGHLAAALGSNAAFVVVLLPLAAYVWVGWLFMSARAAGRVRLRVAPSLITCLIAVELGFAVVRNLPFAHALRA